ncbi:MAG: hypothetical protein ACFFCS_04150 [Candidatus Hodarchaeota archaeon]
MSENAGVDLEEEGKPDDPKDLTTDELWTNVGIHRSVAGFFYNLPLALFQVIGNIFFGGFIIILLYPFPEPQGYRAAATGIFNLFFQAFDLGTANIMARFIGEYNIKDPKKTLQYIQYFIWYQMITGLIQVTLVSSYALFFVPHSQLSYSVWIMLVFCTHQYPGCLHIFHATLNTLQQYDKVTIINFVQGELFNRAAEIGFVLLGRWLGSQNIIIGEMLGIAIGATAGWYFAIIISTFIATHFFQKVMKKYGITVKDCFRHDFDRSMVKECMIWGLKSGLPYVLWGFAAYVHLMIWLTYLPQYTTWISLAGFVGLFAGVIGWRLDLGGSISESYLNGKKKLAQHIFGQTIRYTALVQFFMAMVVVVVLLLFEPVILAIGLDFYVLSSIFILPTMVAFFRNVYDYFSTHTIVSTKHINFNMFLIIFESFFSIFIHYLLIVWWDLPGRYGQPAIAWLIPCCVMVSGGVKTIICYFYIHFKVMKIKIPKYQTFVAPGISFLVILIMFLLYYQFIYLPLNDIIGTWLALIPTIGLLFILVLFVYFPITAILGGFDDSAEEILLKAKKMSGIGRFIVSPMYAMIKMAAKRTKLHNRFALDDTEAIKEGRELMIIKNKILKEKVKIL